MKKTENNSMKVEFIVMAAGNSRRFKNNKLLYPLNGQPVFCYILDTLEQAVRKLQMESEPSFSGRILVVTQYEEILKETERRRRENRKGLSEADFSFWQPGIFSPESVDGVSFTIKNALRAAGKESDWYVFLTADQPFLRAGSIVRLLKETTESKKGIGSMCFGEQPGNPVVFSRRYLPELLALTGDCGGRRIVKKHPEDCCFCQVEDEMELADADTQESMNTLLDYFAET
ncbi:MAG: nucleotidyltransferase family protein [Lachnospiraceae bacterium]|nr:nucleotidyltransferase family protein [Lachnospiraceae bacterium]